MSVFKLHTDLLISTNPLEMVGNLSHAAAGVHTKLGLYSSELRTDGILSESVVNDVVGDETNLLDELVAAGLLLVADFNGEPMFAIARWSEQQLTNAKRAEEREKSRQRMAASRARWAAKDVAPATVAVATETVEVVADATLDEFEIVAALDEVITEVATATEVDEVVEAVEEEVAPATVEEAVEQAVEEAFADVAVATDDEVLFEASVDVCDSDTEVVVEEDDTEEDDSDDEVDYEDEYQPLEEYEDENTLSVADMEEFGLKPAADDAHVEEVEEEFSRPRPHRIDGGKRYGNGMWSQDDFDKFFARLQKEYPGKELGTRADSALAVVMENYDVLDVIRAAQQFATVSKAEGWEASEYETLKHWLRRKEFLFEEVFANNVVGSSKN